MSNLKGLLNCRWIPAIWSQMHGAHSHILNLYNMTVMVPKRASQYNQWLLINFCKNNKKSYPVQGLMILPNGSQTKAKQRRSYPPFITAANVIFRTELICCSTIIHSRTKWGKASLLNTDNSTYILILRLFFHFLLSLLLLIISSGDQRIFIHTNTCTY